MSPIEEIERLSSKEDIFKIYKIGKIIGKGYSGSKIYKAKHLKSHEKYAIKVMNLETIQNVSLESIVREIKMLRFYSRHPNIIKCYGTYFQENVIYFVFEYCEHGSLQDIYNSIFFLF